MSSTSLSRDKINILLLEGVHNSAVDALQRAGYSNIEYHKGALPEAQLIERIKNAHVVGIRSRTQLTEKVLKAADKLIAVGCFCIGTNQVDLAAAQSQGVVVFNAPYSNTRSVAELVLAEMIMLLRGIPAKNAAAHRGDWQKSAANSHEMRGKTLGIVGYGNIGSQLSVMAEALGMQVIFHDVVTKLPLGNAVQVPSLNTLLSQADVVTLHVPETSATKWIIGKTQMQTMKPGAILINASRGTVVEIDPLAEALSDGRLGGAAIDVFPVEPRTNNDAFESPLIGIDNCILTPHIGGSTVEAQANIGVEVAEKLVTYSETGTTTSSVNFPEVALPSHSNKHRLLHIHTNRPGVLSQINQIFSDMGVNISAQYLQTSDQVGYVVMDIDAEHSKSALQALSKIEGTLRSRVLF